MKVTRLKKYKDHFLFTTKIALTLLFRGLVFLLHAFVPVYVVPQKWNLDNIHKKVWDWHWYSEEYRKKHKLFKLDSN
tara:strand:- start:869 stop:1099 length:231 start_codon:yes stop_codon:yes gene_type:complete